MTKIERRFVGRSVSSLARSLRTLAVVALGAGGLAVTARAQQPSASAQRVPCPRPANAPPLVPVRLDRDGNFRIAPPYVPDPAFTRKPNVPKGRVIRFTMNSAESKIFPTAPVPAPRAGGAGRAGQPAGRADAGARRAAARRRRARPRGRNRRPRQRQRQADEAGAPGAGRGAGPADRRSIRRSIARSPSTFRPAMCRTRRRRSSWCRTSAGTSRKTRPLGPDGNPRTDLAFMPTMLDNLIHEKRIPPIVAVLLSPGPGGQRTIEYDTISDRYLNFVETEVLPRITRDHQIAFTTDPDGRATFGESSGSPAALNMAWFAPNLYRRVISYSGTFVALQRNAIAPNGAWDYHDKFIPNSERKPIRIWLHVSGNDNGAAYDRRGHAELDHRQQPDGRCPEEEGLRVSVRLLGSFRPRRSPRAAADDAGSVRVGVEGLQSDRPLAAGP